MSIYQSAQEFKNIRWGTVMPVAVMIGTEIKEVRARGNFSVAVSNPALVEQAVSDPEDLEGCLRMQALRCVTTFIALRSREVDTAAQFTSVTPAVVQVFQAQLSSELEGLGLQVTQVTIDAIEVL
jgi:membrane protease subunit (stomatin/prohibitin family)